MRLSVGAGGGDTGGGAGVVGAVLSLSAFAGSRFSTLLPQATSLIPFLDRISAPQVNATSESIIHCYVASRVPFSVVESSTFLPMTKGLCLAYVVRKLVPSGKKLAGIMVDCLHGDTRRKVLSMLRGWCLRRKVVLVLDACPTSSPSWR